MAKLKAENGFRFLPCRSPRSCRTSICRPRLSNADYPGMVAAGERVETIAVSAVLFAYNWPKGSDRYRRIEAFVEHFFPKLAEFQKPPRHPKWREANLAATLPGWTRFPGAEEWLKRNRAVLQPPTAAVREKFNRFIASRGLASAGTPEERDRLFQAFLKWEQARERR